MTMAEKLHSINMQEACRICLSDDCLITKQPIFETTNGPIKEDAIKYCGILLEEKKGLPTMVCSECLSSLYAAVSFIEKCRDTELLLNEYAKDLEIKEELDFDYFESVDCLVDDSDIKTETEPLKLKKKKSMALQCVTCGAFVQSQSALVNHNRTHTGERPFSCASCGKNFAQKSTMRLHILRVHLKHRKVQKVAKSNTCEVCEKKFSSSTNLKVHMRIHTGETPYECDVCFRRFMQLGTLTSHKRRHNGEKPYACGACGRAFVEKNHLIRHQSVHSEAKPYTCSICNKSVKSSFALKQHVKGHANSKDHICDQCGASFTVKGNLVAHMKVIHSAKSGQCLICNKICSDLGEHMIDHTGEKKYECVQCDKRFAHKRGLIVHSRQHTENHRFQCSFEGCDRTFYAQWLLDCHVSKHTGCTPHVCKFCSKGFLRLYHLNKHLKTNHALVSNEFGGSEG